MNGSRRILSTYLMLGSLFVPTALADGPALSVDALADGPAATSPTPLPAKRSARVALAFADLS